MAITYKVSDKSSRFLVPTGDSAIDVLKMNWTRTPQSGRIDVPVMYLTEYQQNVGQLINAAIYYTRAVARAANGTDGAGFIAGDTDEAIYRFRYFAEPTGFSYKIPFFSQHHTAKNNVFGNDQAKNPFQSLLDLRGSVGQSLLPQSIGAFGSAAVEVASNLFPGAINLENPKSWESSDVPGISVTWDLFNTGTLEQMKDNRNLAHILRYQNSPARRSAFIVDPPVIYDLYIPDIIHMPACYVNDIQITNLGNTYQIKDGQRDIIFPEAYRFKMTFKSLLMDTRNIMNGMDKGRRVSVIEDSTNITNLANAILQEGTGQGPPSPRLQNAASAVDNQFGFERGQTLGTLGGIPQ